MDSAEASPAAGPQPARREQVAAAAILLAALGLCLFLAIRALVTTGLQASDELVLPSEATYRQFECIEEAISRALPEGARVVVDEEDELWAQRLVELSSPGRSVVDTAGEATVVISVEPGSSPQACSGLVLRTTSP